MSVGNIDVVGGFTSGITLPPRKRSGAGLGYRKGEIRTQMRPGLLDTNIP